jgi:hypothetical protein
MENVKMKIKFITKLISAACAATMATSAVAMPVGAINKQEMDQIENDTSLCFNFQGMAYYVGINDPDYLNKIRCDINLINKFDKELERCLSMVRDLKNSALNVFLWSGNVDKAVLSDDLLRFAEHYGKAYEWWKPDHLNNPIAAFRDMFSRRAILEIANNLKQLGSQISADEYERLSEVLNYLEIVFECDRETLAQYKSKANEAYSEYMEAKDEIDDYYTAQALEVSEQLDKKEKQIPEDKEMAEQLRIEEQIRQEVAEQYGIEEQIKEDEKTKKEVQITSDEKYAVEAQLNEAGDSIANYSSYEEARAVAVATQQSIMEQIKKDQKDRSRALLQVRGGVEHRRIANDNNDGEESFSIGDAFEQQERLANEAAEKKKEANAAELVAKSEQINEDEAEAVQVQFR